MDRVLQKLKETYSIYERRADTPYRQKAYKAYQDTLKRIEDKTFLKSKIADTKSSPVFMIKGDEGEAVLLTFDNTKNDSGLAYVKDKNSFLKGMPIIIIGIADAEATYGKIFDNGVNWDKLYNLFDLRKKAFIHEYIHYLDEIKSKGFGKGTAPESRSREDLIRYYNNPGELNAYFHEIASHYDDHVERLKSDVVPEDMKQKYFEAMIGNTPQEFIKNVNKFMEYNHIKNFLDVLTPRNKKAFIKRLYQLYNELREQVEDYSL